MKVLRKKKKKVRRCNEGGRGKDQKGGLENTASRSESVKGRGKKGTGASTEKELEFDQVCNGQRKKGDGATY